MVVNVNNPPGPSYHYVHIFIWHKTVRLTIQEPFWSVLLVAISHIVQWTGTLECWECCQLSLVCLSYFNCSLNIYHFNIIVCDDKFLPWFRYTYVTDIIITAFYWVNKL